MDLAGAMAVAKTTARMPVPGNAKDLLMQVLGSGAVPQGKSLSLAFVPPGVFLRPVAALHLLSLVTAHSYSSGDLHDAYAWWGLLRYLGFLDHEPGPALRVSRAGGQVTGVQRRVASEELGIAFGVLVASLHVRRELGPGVPVGIVDVDVLLRGTRFGSSRRPDYVLVVGPGPSVPEVVFFLECKGTSNPRDCGQQLTTAVQQIAEPLLGYAASAGLAVSTVTGVTQVSCVALELTDDEDEELGENPRRPLRTNPARDMLPGSMETFISAARSSAWSMLGHYAGNQAAARRWSNLRAEPDGSSGDQERRVRFDSAYGPAVGVSTTFDLGDRQLVVTWAIDEQVDDALSGGSPEEVLAAQGTFASELDEIGTRQKNSDEPEASVDPAESDNQLTAGGTIESVMPDGSIFSLTAR